VNPHEFVAKWRNVQLKERSAAQEHFIDLCRLVNHPTPAEADPTGEFFTFEAGAAKQHGGQGFADVWKKGYFAWEYKGQHANLSAAYQQLLQYRESLQNPPLLVVSDTNQLIIHTNFTNTIKRELSLSLDSLLTPAGLDTLKAVFNDPEQLRAAKTAEQATAEAAHEFAKIAQLRRKYGDDPHQIAHFLIRLLFCLFAEDIDLLPKNLFTALTARARRQPGAFTAQLGQLFTAMATGGWFGEHPIRHFDGGLFDSAAVLDLDSDSLDILAHVVGLDWSNIEPSVLGTLFERSLDPNNRTQLGAHYTSKDDILLIIEPVLMAPLRRKWQSIKTQAAALIAARDAAPTPRQRDNRHKELTLLLRGFADEIAAVRVLDPACGSGNFLYVALKQLLDLQKEVMALSGQLAFPTVDPAQLYGLEVNPYAHELAQATVWIGYIQWLRDNGYGLPAEPILKPLHNITLMDAILAWDEAGQPTQPAWPAADVIIGNPPFLGGGKLRAELGNAYTDAIFKLYGNRIPNFSDLVCYWFERARALLEAGQAQRAGLLATNSIRGGANRKVLERIKQSGNIFMAHSDRPWIQGGAAVRVSMVGFDNGTETERTLDGQPVKAINADLTSAIDLTRALPLPENAGFAFIGPSPKAPFDIDSNIAQQMLKAPLNINGRPNSDVVRPLISASDIVQRSRNKWTIDFALMEEDEAALYEMPFEYVREVILPVRQNRRDDYRGQWWQYARPRPEMRTALQHLQKFIATPRVAKHRIFEWVTLEFLANDRTTVIARDDDYFFGVLHSRIHEVWSLATASWHGVGNDPTYNATTCFETYPFPWPPGQEPPHNPLVQAIAQAAQELVTKRNNWLNPPGATEAELKPRTLTNLYNQRPAWLELAHKKLDNAVLAAYRATDPAQPWPNDITAEQILAQLLNLNRQRAQPKTT